MASCELVKIPKLKTINDVSLFGIGNIEIKGGGSASVQYATCVLDAFQSATYKDVAIEGITENSTPVLDIIVDDQDNINRIYKSWSCIYKATTHDGYIRFYSSSATEIPLNVQILVFNNEEQ